MNSQKYNLKHFVFLNIKFFFMMLILPAISYSQDEGVPPYPQDTTYIEPKVTSYVDTTIPNGIAGEFTPGKGFDIINTGFGSLNVSGYICARWVDQIPPNQTFQDNLSRERSVITRNDILIHRVFVWLTGFIGNKNFRYNLTMWGLPTTNQVLLFGNIQYKFSPKFTAGVGIGPNLGIRSLQGTWPFFNSSDRQLGEESYRPGFTGSVWGTGQIFPRFFYTAAIGTNVSLLGVKADQLTRHFTYSTSFWWMPTTGEFGPRGGNGDLEHHLKPATRFGVSLMHAYDGRYGGSKDSTTLNTQTRISDGVLVYERSALAPGVTLLNTDYDFASVDLAFKYRGFFLMLQYFVRGLSNFSATGPLPMSSIVDHMVQADMSYMVIPRTLNAYVSGAYSFDQFERHPNEIAVGLNYYPFKTRSVRLNGSVINVYKSSAGGLFGFYSVGLTGQVLSIGIDILL